jgi:hypothetical protein
VSDSLRQKIEDLRIVPRPSENPFQTAERMADAMHEFMIAVADELDQRLGSAEPFAEHPTVSEVQDPRHEPGCPGDHPRLSCAEIAGKREDYADRPSTHAHDLVAALRQSVEAAKLRREIAARGVDHDHEWVDETTISDHHRHFRCACGISKIEARS